MSKKKTINNTVDDTLYQNQSSPSTTFKKKYHNNFVEILELKISHWHDNFMFKY